MPAEDRNKWSNDITEKKTPNFEREIVIPTIQNLLLSQDNFFAKKVDGIFKNLSGEHITNSPTGFTKRIIMSNILNSFGNVNYEKVNYINDLRFVVSKLIGIKGTDFEGRRTQDDIRNIIKTEQYGKWFLIDGGLLKIKLFKKGTAHMEVFPSVAIKLNKVLATLHPKAITSKHRTINKKIKEFKLEKDFLSSEVLDELSKIIENIYNNKKLSFFYYPSGVSSETRIKVFEIIQLLDGLHVKNHLSFSYNPINILMDIKMKGYIPERKSHQFYPTEDSLAELVISMILINEWDTILESSAGNGSLLDKVYLKYKTRATCLDISETQVQVLKEKGYNTNSV